MSPSIKTKLSEFVVLPTNGYRTDVPTTTYGKLPFRTKLSAVIDNYIYSYVFALKVKILLLLWKTPRSVASVAEVSLCNYYIYILLTKTATLYYLISYIAINIRVYVMSHIHQRYGGGAVKCRKCRNLLLAVQNTTGVNLTRPQPHRPTLIITEARAVFILIARENLHLTQCQIADLICISQPAVQKHLVKTKIMLSTATSIGWFDHRRIAQLIHNTYQAYLKADLATQKSVEKEK